MFKNLATKSIACTMLTALMMTTGVDRADAGSKDVAKVVGTAFAVCIMINKCRVGKKPVRKGGYQMSAAERQQNMDMQSALNAFNFNAGQVDGLPGKQTRSAIRGFQNYMGYPVTGRLEDWQRQTLVRNWYNYRNGAGNAYPRMMAAVGARGLLKTEVDPNYPRQFGDMMADGRPNVPAPGPIAIPPKDGEILKDTDGRIQFPERIGNVASSAAARCELVVQTSRIQGGAMQATNMTDPNQALSEKFCEARGFAITRSQAIASQYTASEDEMTQFCEQISRGFADVRSQLPASQPDVAASTIKSAATRLQLTDPATAADFGQICLGMGYRLDNSEMALAGALTLVASGHAPYQEIVGHHLREGFGVPATPKSSVPWYKNAVSALENGAAPAFVPSTTADRIQVIRAALQISERSANLIQFPQRVPVSSQFPAVVPAQN